MVATEPNSPSYSKYKLLTNNALTMVTTTMGSMNVILNTARADKMTNTNIQPTNP